MFSEGDFDGVNREDDEDHDHVTDDVSVNPLYGDVLDPAFIPMGWIQSPGDEPTSTTMKSVTNPNYETTLEVGAQRQRAASNPIYQTTTQFEEENPLYETGAGFPQSAVSSADVNPLYEPGPAGSVHGGIPADLNPLYQSAESYSNRCDINPLYEGTSSASPLNESTAEEPRYGGLNNGEVRRRVDSRSKKEGRQRRKEDELPIMDGAFVNWADHDDDDDDDDDDGLGVINRGADITVNELYGSVEQPHSTPLESETEAPPVPPRQHVKRS